MEEGKTVVFQIIAIVILVAFYGCYVAKMLNQRKKGIQTDQMGKGKVGLVKFIEVTMKISAILVFGAGLVSILTGTSRGPVPLRAAGAVISALGTVFFVISVLTMRDNWRAGVPEKDETELVTSGIYQWSRNPAFLGFDLLYIGMLMMFFSWALLALTVFAITMYHLQIVNVEEEYLLKAFGDDYLQYKKKVCRYIGRKRS